MHLVHLPANQAWAFVFGDDVATAQIIPMGDSPRFHESRDAAVEAARACGLEVTKSGRVMSDADFEALADEAERGR